MQSLGDQSLRKESIPGFQRGSAWYWAESGFQRLSSRPCRSNVNLDLAEEEIADRADRTVDSVGDDKVSAGFCIVEQNHGEGSETGREQLGTIAAFEFTDELFQFEVGRRAAGA